jgi:hypothetical protein
MLTAELPEPRESVSREYVDDAARRLRESRGQFVSYDPDDFLRVEAVLATCPTLDPDKDWIPQLGELFRHPNTRRHQIAYGPKRVVRSGKGKGKLLRQQVQLAVAVYLHVRNRLWMDEEGVVHRGAPVEVRIPAGCVLHHECLSGECINPHHCRMMTQGDHARLHAKLRKAAKLKKEGV